MRLELVAVAVGPDFNFFSRLRCDQPLAQQKRTCSHLTF